VNEKPVTEKKPAKILSFCRDSGYGVFEMEGKRYEYHCTYFHSGLPARFPRVDEDVEIVLEDNRVVEVRALRTKTG
jgi:hypothetical protein